MDLKFKEDFISLWNKFFEEAETNGVFTPWGSGCSTIVSYPFLEKDSIRPRAVIGMFDVSPRCFVLENALSFAVSMCKFERMVHNMDESFLITKSWKAVQKRVHRKLGNKTA